MGEPYRYSLRVRYSECDMQGVVFNGNYLAYFDISLTELWRAAFGSYQAMLDRGYDLVVAEARVGFKAPARFDDVLEVSIGVAKLGNTSLITHHELARGAELVASGEMCHVFVNRDTMAKAPIPAWARGGLSPWMLPGD